MAQTITLKASAAYGYGGKQFVARISGRDSKFTFNREFLGRKEGKRGDYTEFETDEPGLYETRDVDRKGDTTEEYFVVYPAANGIASAKIDKKEAMQLAKEIESGSADLYREGLRHRINFNLARIANSESKNDPDGTVDLDGDVGSLKKGETVTRGRLIEERREIIAKLEAELNGSVPTPEASDRDAVIRQIRAMMMEYSITISDIA